MSDHSSPPWDQTLEAVVTWDGDVIASVTESDFSGDVDDANLRRIVAAVNATKDITTAGLEEIAAKGLTLQLALMASAMVSESGPDHWSNHAKHVFKQPKSCHLCVQGEPPYPAQTAQNTNDEQADAEAFRGSRGD